MNNQFLTPLILAAALLPSALRAQETSKWTFDASLYGLAAGMSGTVGAGPFNADVDFGFDKVLDNLDFAMMGKVRVGYERWALNTDVVFLGLGASKNGVSVDMDQWMVEPTISYRVCKYFEALAGVRYNNLSGEIRGPNFEPGPGLLPRRILPRRGLGLLDGPGIRTGTQEWWDPIVGANLTVPLGKQFSFNVRGDIGGFGAGSDFTWQAFPCFGWQFAKWGSLQAGYRWLYMDYETGTGWDRFEYDMLVQGPQIGITFHF